jgi:hypothetical protein
MRSAGLRSDDQAVNAGIDWVARQVIAREQMLMAEDIAAAVDTLDLRQGQTRSIVRVTARLDARLRYL